jgi:hypothetical protein
MESIREDTIGGFNSFLKKQKSEAGKATLTLVQFDSQDPYEVIHRFAPIGTIPGLTHETFVPRAATPLLDALGRGINDLEKGLADLPKKERPSKVIVVVVTDGQENSSTEFSKERVETMIREKTEKEDWQFVFLSADLAAIGDASAVGIQAQAVLLFEKNSRGSEDAWCSLAERTSDFRSSKISNLIFNEEDRKHPDDPGMKRPRTKKS